MEVKNCKNCAYFRLHYVKGPKKYSPLSYGHCVYPRLKRRYADTSACEYYQKIISKKTDTAT